jgi:hypothetical protein
MGWIFRHYKGGIYEVIGTGTHTETGEELVFYKDTLGKHWIRPKGMFREEVEIDGKKVPRFEKIGSFDKNLADIFRYVTVK